MGCWVVIYGLKLDFSLSLFCGFLFYVFFLLVVVKAGNGRDFFLTSGGGGGWKWIWVYCIEKMWFVIFLP